MKTIVLLILALTASSVLGECLKNAIANKFPTIISIEQELVQQTSGFKFCQSLIKGTAGSCCSSQTIDGFQDSATALVKELQALVASRDKFIIAKRQDVVNVKSSLSRLSTAANGAVENATPTDFAALLVLGLAQGIGEMASAITNDYTTLKNNFTQFQEARSACINTLVSTQAAAWCFACDPKVAENGLVGDKLTLSETLQKRLATDCFPYIEYSVGQSVILSLYYIRSFLDTLVSAMEKIVAGDATAMETLVNTLTQLGTVDYPESVGELPVKLPTACSATSCGWLTSDIFVDAAINKEKLAIGGFVDTKGSFGRLLGEEDDDEDVPAGAEGGRRLSGSWNPAANEAGVMVEFPTNPGEVDNESTTGTGAGAVRNGVIACAVAFVALAF